MFSSSCYSRFKYATYQKSGHWYVTAKYLLETSSNGLPILEVLQPIYCMHPQSAHVHLLDIELSHYTFLYVWE